MRTYDIKLALSGELKAQVRKRAVTAPEALVLQYRHGAGSILEKRVVGWSKTSQRAERDRLKAVYGEKTVNDLFGMHGPLPAEAEDLGQDPEPEEDDDEISLEPDEVVEDEAEPAPEPVKRKPGRPRKG